MIKPYKFQTPIISDIAKALRRLGVALMVMATGTGKTYTSAFVARMVIGSKDRVLFLCHNNDILRQAMRSYRKVLDSRYTLGLFNGEEKAPPETNILFASFQTMRNLKEEFGREHFDFVIVDEGHHGHAETYRDVIEYFKPRMLLGMTATPDREDGLDIRDLFGSEIVKLTLEEAIAKQYLAPAYYKVMTVGTASREALERLKIRVREGERISLREFNDRVFNERLDEEIVGEIERYRKQGIIFCPNIAQTERMAERLTSARPYHSLMSRKDCEDTLKAFRAGRVRCLLTVDKFNEGIDIPDAELIVFLRSTESKTIFLQQLGRGLRKVAGKHQVTVLDFVANAERMRELAEFAGRIKGYGGDGPQIPDGEFEFDASGIEFDIEEESQDILNILRQIEVGFYPFAEAMEVVRRMGVKNREVYELHYREDPRLPSNPNVAYASEWRGWPHFLTGLISVEFYSFAEAMWAVKRMGVKSGNDYKLHYKEDSRLPSNPNRTYSSEWKDWSYFLTGVIAVEFYPFAEAMEVVRRMGVKSERAYTVRHEEDPRLPSAPRPTYASEWKGWSHFLMGVMPTVFYPFAEAMRVVKRMGVKSERAYKVRYKEDPRLPSNPNAYYSSEWKDWSYFLTGVIAVEFYPFAEAMWVVKRMGVKTGAEYKTRYKEDTRLPSNPHMSYSSEWISWHHFLTGVRSVEFYSFAEAMWAVKRMGVKTGAEYKTRYKEDPCLPSNPNIIYASSWISWPHFLSRKSMRPKKS